jgi:acyl-CoA hydrolase
MVGRMRIISEQELGNRLGSLSERLPRVVVTGNWASPKRALEILDANLERYRVFMLGCRHPISDRPAVRFETPFVGAGMRRSSALDYIPMRLSLVPRLFAISRQPDVVIIHTSVPRDGKVSLGIEVNVLPAALEVARARGALVVAQINPRMPYTFGEGEIPTDMVDVAIEVEQALDTTEGHSSDGRKEQIGEYIAQLVPDGATLQLGIGAIPDATLGRLVHRRGLRIWSEMISDGVLALERAGALDQEHQIVTSFIGGSEELYEWADANPRLRMFRTETTNDPAMIAINPMMISINAAVQIDLFAQANASYVGGRIFSGFGGQTDFIVGALHSAGGQAVIGLPSWHDKSKTSTVVPLLEMPATSFQHSVVVTDQGCAHVFGRSQHDQARLLIEEAAAPQARDELWDAAERLGLADSKSGTKPSDAL